MKFIKNLYSKMADNTFNISYILVAIVAILISFSFSIPALQIISISLLRVGLYTLTSTLLVKFLNGTGCDIYKEIFVEHNTSAGVFTGALLLGLAIVMAVAI